MRTIPRLKIAHLPTPVEALPRLSAFLNGPKLFVKRDDQTGLAMGGNKTRKLEFLVAEAQANGARMLITAGATQSNHCRQTAAACARFGFDCLLILSGEKPDNSSGNIFLDQLLNAEIIWTSYDERDAVLQEAFDSAWKAGRRPYLIPYGGSNSTGATGYVYAIQELLEQQLQPDWIVFPTSSGGTQAGLVAGSALFGFTGKVLGISVDESAQELSEKVANLATQTSDFLGEKIHFNQQDILVNDEYIGEGYAIMDAKDIEAIHLFARKEGLLLDPVYTGKAAAGLIDLARKGFFKPTESVLFWHTGGTPALFSEKYANLIPG